MSTYTLGYSHACEEVNNLFTHISTHGNPHGYLEASNWLATLERLTREYNQHAARCAPNPFWRVAVGRIHAELALYALLHRARHGC